MVTEQRAVLKHFHYGVQNVAREFAQRLSSSGKGVMRQAIEGAGKPKRDMRG